MSAVSRGRYPAIENLPPAYFSLVMATGIVSIACNLLGKEPLAIALFVINIACFGTLCVMLILRLLFYPARAIADLRTHTLGPGYFTLVAGTSVLGIQVISIADNSIAAWWLWVVAGSLWVVISYALFASLIARPDKPDLGTGLSGLWLIAAVATQSVSILGTLIAPQFGPHQEVVLFLCLALYLMGCMLYLLIIGMIFYRLTFLELAPQEMTPPYWINMGATAITTQAGATLILSSSGSPLLTELLPFLKGFTLFFWAAGTWWIPLLIALGVWTYLLRGVPMTYSPQFWGAVFPIGMYTACTYQFAQATGAEYLIAIPELTVYFALIAWATTFTGLLRRLLRRFVNGSDSEHAG